MAQLVVRNLEDELKQQLQLRAGRAGRSMEAEVREILRNAMQDEKMPGKGLGSEIADIFRGVGLDEEIPELHGRILNPAVFEP